MIVAAARLLVLSGFSSDLAATSEHLRGSEASQMLQERYGVPLSPPTSPRMSDAATKLNDHKYQQVPQRLHETLGAEQETARTYSRGQAESPLQPHERGLHEGAHGHSHAPATYPPRQFSSGPQPARATHGTFTASTPTSPHDRLTPRSPASISRDQLDDDEDLVEYGGDDQEEDDDGERPTMTPAELRAQKRKMKRFRLTHNQTRFLMSEFARQAHPDAAHRERLAREIPGLSARQVQVWFQNRRAKLKRLTNDDRERMLRSRALPADFDTTQTLHSPFGAQVPSMVAAPISSVGAYGFGDSGGPRPLTLDTLRRVPDYEQYGQQYASSTGVSPALGAFGFTPPQSASEHLSPGSVASSMSPYVLQNSRGYDSARRPPTSLPTSHPAQQPQLHRMPLHDRLGITVGESTGSPLRSSESYASLTSASAQPRHIPERAASYSDHIYNPQRPQLQSTSSPGSSDPGTHSLGFSYSQVPHYQQSEQQHQVPIAGAYQSSEPEQYRRSGPTSYAQYPLSNFSSHQPPYAGYSAQYSADSYHNTYSQHGQVTEPLSQPTRQQHGYQAVVGASQPYMHASGPNELQVTDGQTHSMPASY